METLDPTGGIVQLTAGLLADCANIAADGKLNLMGVFDRIVASHVPLIHPAVLKAIDSLPAPQSPDADPAE